MYQSIYLPNEDGQTLVEVKLTTFIAARRDCSCFNLLRFFLSGPVASSCEDRRALGAGKHQQIVVLTCRLRSFEPLGGTHVAPHSLTYCSGTGRSLTESETRIASSHASSNPASEIRTRILKIRDQRLAHEIRRTPPENEKNAPQRLATVSVNRGNVAQILTSGTWPQRRDWLADDAVSCELVSTPNSLLTGKLTGNFAESGHPPRFSCLINARIQ